MIPDLATTTGDPAATFRAMSVEVTLLGSGVQQEEVDRAASNGQEFGESWENLFSRFRPDSLLSLLNAAGGASVDAPPIFLDVLEQARNAVVATGGRFDPAVLPALEAAGYDRDISLVRSAEGALEVDPAAAVPAMGPGLWRKVEIDRAAGTVRLPAGMRIDLGGIAKGAFVDLLVARLAEWPGGLVDAGGDLRAWGTAPDGLPWRVAIENPSQPEQDAAFVDLLDPTRAGAVATSGVLRRRLRGNGHHLIDPRTGLPAVTTFAAVTAIAPTCAAAEIAAKSLLIGDWTAATGLTDALAVAAGISFDGSLQFIDGGYRDAIEIELAV